MQTVLLVAYLLIVIALIAVILLQRSEGGALGIGGGSNQFMTARGSANLLTRTTAILATLFFAMAIGLTILAEFDRGSQSILDRAQQTQDGSQPTSVLDALNQLQGGDAASTPAAPETSTEAPAAPTSTDTPDLAVPAAPAAPESAAPAAETTPAAPSDAAPAAAPAEPATSGDGKTTTN